MYPYLCQCKHQLEGIFIYQTIPQQSKFWNCFPYISYEKSTLWKFINHSHRYDGTDSDTNWEDVGNGQDLNPILECDCDDWVEKFTNSIWRYHGISPKLVQFGQWYVDLGLITGKCRELNSLCSSHFKLLCFKMTRSRPIEAYCFHHSKFLVIAVVYTVLPEFLNYTISTLGCENILVLWIIWICLLVFIRYIGPHFEGDLGGGICGMPQRGHWTMDKTPFSDTEN